MCDSDKPEPDDWDWIKQGKRGSAIIQYIFILAAITVAWAVFGK